MHQSVMARESLEYLAVRPDGKYVDATAGLGGHTALIAQKLTTGFVIANDRDAQSLELARTNTEEWADCIRYHQGAFSELAETVKWADGGKRSARHAHGSVHGHDGGRPGQSHC